MATSTIWTWSEDHQNYYYWAQDGHGQAVCVWYEQSQSIPAAPPVSYPSASTPWPNSRSASGAYTYQTPTPRREVIRGTSGYWERLDSSYFVREGTVCQQFFRKGRVFSMLWSEPAGSTSNNNGVSDAFSVVKFGEKVYTNIRRFVIVHAPHDKGFVYACGITTYSGRGVLKDGCSPKDHSAVYFTGHAPVVLQDEYKAGMTNEAIEVEPSSESGELSWASRVNFGRTVCIEKNVKVKDLGRVVLAQMSALINYWKVAKGDEDDD